MEASVSATIDKQALLDAAAQARLAAYAPYSKYKVGAAVLADDGRVYTGANVENASYGLTICAERAAIFAAANAGARKLRAVAVVVGGRQPGRPCGACRQVIREFGTDVLVLMAGAEGGRAESTIAELLPASFGPEALGS